MTDCSDNENAAARRREDWRLFVDLDGVLVDFDSGVRRLFGRGADEVPPKQLWPVLARSAGFYDKLPWTADGRRLWDYCRRRGATILTGVPWGNWAEAQKLSWCRRELGAEVEVVTCPSREKHLRAQELLRDGERAVLVDDRQKLQADWEEFGGVFVLHRSAAESIAALEALGLGPEDKSPGAAQSK